MKDEAIPYQCGISRRVVGDLISRTPLVDEPRDMDWRVHETKETIVFADCTEYKASR